MHPFLRALTRIGHDGPVLNTAARTLTWHRSGEPIAQAHYVGILWWSAGGAAVWAETLPEFAIEPEASVRALPGHTLSGLDEAAVHALVGKAAQATELSLVTKVPWKGGELFVGLTEGGLAEGIDVPPPPGEAEVADRFQELAAALEESAALGPQLEHMAHTLQAMLVDDVDAPTDPAAVLLRKLILALREAQTGADADRAATILRVQGTAKAVHERASKADGLVEPADLLVGVLRWMQSPGGDPMLASRIHRRLSQLAAAQDAASLAQAMAIGVEKGLGIDGLEAIFLRAAPESAHGLVHAAASQLRD